MNEANSWCYDRLGQMGARTLVGACEKISSRNGLAVTAPVFYRWLRDV